MRALLYRGDAPGDRFAAPRLPASWGGGRSPPATDAAPASDVASSRTSLDVSLRSESCPTGINAYTITEDIRICGVLYGVLYGVLCVCVMPLLWCSDSSPPPGVNRTWTSRRSLETLSSGSADCGLSGRGPAAANRVSDDVLTSWQ